MTAEIPQTFPLPMKIEGIGRFLPRRIVTSKELEERCGLPDGWCEHKQGIGERRWVTDETVAYMGAEAIKEAVDDAGLALSDLDMIFCATNSFDRVIPDQASQIQAALGLEESGIPCMGINSGCLSFIAALDIGACLLARKRFNRIAVVSPVISSINADFNNPVVCTMVGDGASAVVLSRTLQDERSAVHAVHMATYSAGADVSGFSGEERRRTMFTKDVTSGDVAFQFDPQHMLKTGMRYGKNFLKKLWPLMNADSFKAVIATQSTRLSLEYLKLSFPADRIVSVIDRFGNCGAAGYGLALYDAVSTRRIQRGDLVLLYGMGAGWSIYGMVLVY